jgi:hypothetical protein
MRKDEFDLDLSLGHVFNTEIFEKLLSKLTIKLQDDTLKINTIRFDMSQLRYLSVGGLISFLTLCGAIKENKLYNTDSNCQMYFKLPSNSVLEHLHWMQFFKVCKIIGIMQDNENLCEKDEEYYDLWKRKINKYNSADDSKKEIYKAKFLPIQYIPIYHELFGFEGMCHDFINIIRNAFDSILQYDMKFSPEFKSNFFQSNYELLKNIYQHSESWGIVAIQVLKDSIQFSYSDIGIGIKNSLNKITGAIKGEKDCYYIGEAVKKGVSSRVSNVVKSNNNDNLGLGLYIVTSYVKKAKGKMMIRSGTCRYYSESNFKDTLNFPGVQIHVTIPKVDN